MIFWGIWFWGGVIGQAVCAAHMITAAVKKWPVSSRRWIQIWWAYCIGALPPLWQALASAAFGADWKGERERHWFYYIDDESAGLVLVPFLLITALFVARALTNEAFRKRSVATLVMLLTSAAICLWYCASVLFFEFTEAGDAPGVSRVSWLFFPGVSGLSYLLLSRMIWRDLERKPPAISFLLAWFGALAAALVAKVILAMRFYEQLPDERPDCFVVSAAAKGHRSVVQSWQHPTLDKPVNRQWERFKVFENGLALRSPQIHTRLRAVYSWIGPIVACGIRNPWLADVVYLALKPLEWCVAAIGWLARRFRQG